jgi:hypothetical protein
MKSLLVTIRAAAARVRAFAKALGARAWSPMQVKRTLEALKEAEAP